MKQRFKSTVSIMFVCVLTLGSGCTMQIPVISYEEIKALLDDSEAMKTAAIIDVRPHAEWAAGYIQDALNIELETFVSPLGILVDDGSALAALVPDKATKLIVYGTGDDRARQFAAKARQVGYSDVNYYQGGITDWKSHGDYLVMAYAGFKAWYDAACPFNDSENYLIDVDPHSMYVDAGHIPAAVNVVSDYFIKFGITNEGKDLTEVITSMDANMVLYCLGHT